MNLDYALAVLVLGLGACFTLVVVWRLRGCDEWLAAGSSTGHDTFCPNAALVERMRSAAQR